MALRSPGLAGRGGSTGHFGSIVTTAAGSDLSVGVCAKTRSAGAPAPKIMRMDRMVFMAFMFAHPPFDNAYYLSSLDQGSNVSLLNSPSSMYFLRRAINYKDRIVCV